MAVFSMNPASVIVNRGTWKALSSKEKYQLVALELFGLSKFENRYDVDSIIGSNFELIRATNLSGIPKLRTVVTESENRIDDIAPYASRVVATDRSISVAITCPAEGKNLVAVATSSIQLFVAKGSDGEEYYEGKVVGSDEDITQSESGRYRCVARIRANGDGSFVTEASSYFSRNSFKDWADIVRGETFDSRPVVFERVHK